MTLAWVILKFQKAYSWLLIFSFLTAASRILWPRLKDANFLHCLLSQRDIFILTFKKGNGKSEKKGRRSLVPLEKGWMPICFQQYYSFFEPYIWQKQWGDKFEINDIERVFFTYKEILNDSIVWKIAGFHWTFFLTDWWWYLFKPENLTQKFDYTEVFLFCFLKYRIRTRFVRIKTNFELKLILNFWSFFLLETLTLITYISKFLYFDETSMGKQKITKKYLWIRDKRELLAESHCDLSPKGWPTSSRNYKWIGATFVGGIRGNRLRREWRKW